MIVVSLLLILVAVTLLVLGLTGGSSGLLISSIVASLLAAVFLVVGARQAAAARRAGERSAPPAPGEPLAPAYADENSVFVAEPEFAAAAEETARRRQEHVPDDPLPRDDAFAGDSGGYPGAGDQRETVQFDSGEIAAGRPSTTPGFAAADGAGAAYADQAGAAPGGDLSADEAHDPGRPDPDDPNLDRASGVLNASRSESPPDDSRRGKTAGDGPSFDPAPDSPSSPDLASSPEPASSPGVGAEPGFASSPGFAAAADQPAAPEEFADPDADDPDDEPLPQAVKPTDAVRVARLDAEVLVVDGRPRYHLPECPSLVGRLAEPIPVGEAVELGFSPCGLCRPVDRLVGAAARR